VSPSKHEEVTIKQEERAILHGRGEEGEVGQAGRVVDMC